MLGILTAVFWSPSLSLVLRAAGESGSILTIHFYVVLWGALSCFLLLVLSGQLSGLSIFRRRETHMLVLAALGGYGFWLLRALALEDLARQLSLWDAGRPADLHAGLLPHFPVLWFAGPLLLGVLSIPSREGARVRQIAALLLGFLGCIVIARSFGRGAVSGHTSLLALGSAACWAIFTLLARPAVREGRALPVLTIVLGIGAACLLATRLATGPGRLLIASRALWLSMLAGGVCGGLGLLCWLGALAVAPPATVAPLWYLTAVFAVVWARWIGDLRPGWTVLLGAALVIAGAYVAFAGRRGDAEAEDLTL